MCALKTVILIFSFFSLTAYSQQKNAFNLFFVAGVSPSQVHGDSYSGFRKVGAIGGIGVESVFSEKASMSLSFQFIQKGAKKNPVPTKGDLSAYYLNMNYLEVPLLVTYTQKKFLFQVVFTLPFRSLAVLLIWLLWLNRSSVIYVGFTTIPK